MSFFRRSRQLLSGALLALVLFCQAALAVAACVSPERCPAMALASASCEDGRQAGAMTGNLCLAHATASDQPFDGIVATPAVPPMDLQAGLVVPSLPVVQASKIPSAGQHVLVAASPPPIPILYCTFLL